MPYIAIIFGAIEALTLVLWQRDRQSCLNAIVARNPQEFQRLENKPLRVATKTEPNIPSEEPFGMS